jgi:hypothetical protein
MNQPSNCLLCILIKTLFPTLNAFASLFNCVDVNTNISPPCKSLYDSLINLSLMSVYSLLPII